jgi:FkbM family methyltransferase
LPPAGRLRYAADQVRARLGRLRGVQSYPLSTGGRVWLRGDSTDRKVFDEIFLQRIYAPYAGLIGREGRPPVLVDLGANIGLSALFLHRALDFDRVIAIEPDSGNLQLLRCNLHANRVPVEAVQAFAGGQRGYARLVDAGFGAWGLRMGEACEDGIPVLPLTEIIPDAPGGAVLKCDIEGAERHLFPRIAEWDARVRFIILELHTEFFTPGELRAALAASNFEWHWHGAIAPGAVCAVLGLERGALQPEPVTLQSGGDSRDPPGGAAAV